MATRYVNTASTAGTQDGTTNVAGNSGTCAFATLASALAHSSIVSGGALTGQFTIYCSGTAADTAHLDHTPMQFTTTAANYLEVIGDNTTGAWNDQAYRLELTDKWAIYNQYASHVRLKNVQAMVKSTTNSGVGVFRLSTANNGNGTPPTAPYFVFDGCIARRDPSSTPGDRVDGFSNSICADGSQAGSLYIVNCLVYGVRYSRGMTDDSSAWIVSGQKILNCTVYGAQYGYEITSVVKNCIGAGCYGSDFISVGAGSNFNASQDGTASGANSLTNKTFVFFNAEQGDFRIKTTDATGVIGGGTVDPSGSGLFPNDIAGNVRGAAYDIGMWEATASTVALTGTATATIAESDVVAGGKTVILTATNDSFVSNSGEIGYVGGQVGGFAGTVSNTDVSFNLSNGIGAALAVPQAGDLVVISFCVGSTADRTLSITNTAGTAYTLIGSELYADDTFDANLRVAYRFMPGTPETDFRFAGGTGNAADAGRYTVQVFRGVDTSTTLDVAAVTATGINTRLVNPPSITPTTVGSVIVVVGGAASSTGGTFTTTGLEDFIAGSTADTNDAQIGSGWRRWTSGAYDHGAFTAGGTDTTNDSWASVVFALRPANASAFDNARAALRDGVDSAQAEGTGWDALKTTTMPVGNVVRTSTNVVTITLQAAGTYNITAQETITATLPTTAMSSATARAASPTFTISAAGGGATIGGPVFDGRTFRSLTAGRVLG
jgi:hypothetical protein